MALADLQAVFNQINQSANREQQGQQFAAQQKQQQQEFERQHALEQERLEYQHEFQNAQLAAAQAYQKGQQVYQYASNPAAARNIGTMVPGTSQQGWQGTIAPTQAETYPVSNQYTLPTVGGPVNMNIITPEEEGRQAALQIGPTKALENQYAASLKKQEEDAAKEVEQIRVGGDMDRAKLEAQNRKDIQAAQAASAMAVENKRSETSEKVAEIEAGKNLQLQYHPEVSNQWIDDLANGVKNADDFNRDTGLSKMDRYAIQEGLTARKFNMLSKEQQTALKTYQSILPTLESAKELTARYPDVRDETTKGMAEAYAKGKLAWYQDPNIKRLNTQIDGDIGTITQQGGMTSFARTTQAEAFRLLAAIKPTEQPITTNIKQLNAFIDKVHNKLDETLQGMNEDQKKYLINAYSKGHSADKIIDADHLKAEYGVTSGNPSIAPASRPTPPPGISGPTPDNKAAFNLDNIGGKDKADREKNQEAIFNNLPVGAKIILNGHVHTKTAAGGVQ